MEPPSWLNSQYFTLDEKKKKGENLHNRDERTRYQVKGEDNVQNNVIIFIKKDK